jgi:DNA adenine methylase
MSLNNKFLYSPIKWIGSKKCQLETIIPPILNSLRYNNLYIEPFVGSGSVIIELLKQCHIYKLVHIKFKCYDINEILIAMFNEIKYRPLNLINNLKKFENMKTKDDYHRIRKEYNEKPTVDKFIYLNKTGYRGLYQVNKNGEYNTSFGHYKNPTIFKEENIRELSKLLNYFNVTFEVSDYRDVVKSIRKPCVIYLDPPYFETTNNLRGVYSKNKFCHEEYIEFLYHIRNNSKITLIHSNSVMLNSIYETNENVEVIELYDRMNSKNPGKTRLELLYY